MKRRVARDHSNKRVLRSLSARHSFSHDAFHVLCDASFLRALLQLPECSQPSRGKRQDDRRPSFSHGAPSNPTHSQDPFQLLKALTLQSLDVLDRQSMKGKDRSGNDGSGGGKLSKQLSRMQWTYLPSTARVLTSMCDSDNHHGENHDDASKEKKKRLGPGRDGSTSLQFSAVKKLLSNLHMIRERDSRSEKETSVSSDSNHFLSKSANEAKAIESFTAHHQRRRRQSLVGGSATSSDSTPLLGTPVLMERSIFLFVATQSHDVRRRLPEDAALLRLTHHPTAMWVEIRGEQYPYDTDPSRASVKHHSNDQWKNQGRNTGSTASRSSGIPTDASSSATPTFGATPRGPKISPADLAFLKHLGKDVMVDNAVLRRKSSISALHDKSSPPSPAVTPGESVKINSSGSQPAENAPIRRKRKAEAHPNPLAVKKKQKKEVIRL